MKKLALVFLLVVSVTRAFSNNTDSIGVRHINGTDFILHKVSSNETLYGLLKKYHCSDNDVFAVNPELNNSSRIYVNQVLKFPAIAHSESSRATPSKPSTASRAEKKTPIIYTWQNHKVIKGETLYAICKKYGISLSQLKSWNNLSGSKIKIGQNLIVGKTARNLETAKPKLAPVSKVESSVNARIESNLPPESEEVTEYVVPNAPRGERVEEIGIAQVISTDNKTFKHLALHKTAPYGTLLMVTNEANKAHVMVKVIGKLPETGENNDVLVRLSPSAFQKLNPRDTRLRAKVAYTLAPSSSR